MSIEVVRPQIAENIVNSFFSYCCGQLAIVCMVKMHIINLTKLYKTKYSYYNWVAHLYCYMAAYIFATIIQSFASLKQY